MIGRKKESMSISSISNQTNYNYALECGFCQDGVDSQEGGVFPAEYLLLPRLFKDDLSINRENMLPLLTADGAKAITASDLKAIQLSGYAASTSVLITMNVSLGLSSRSSLTGALQTGSFDTLSNVEIALKERNAEVAVEGDKADDSSDSDN